MLLYCIRVLTVREITKYPANQGTAFGSYPGAEEHNPARVRCLDPSAVPALEYGIRPKKRPMKKKAKSTNSHERMVMKEKRKRK